MKISDTDKVQYRWIQYIFKFSDDRPDIEFVVLINKETLLVIPPGGSAEQEWTRLGYCRCSICPLDTAQTRNCPIAFNISGLIEQFAAFTSYEPVDVEVHTEERIYFKNDSLQEGLRSILGIYMASSGCPHMNVLKPMVRFHLPFASVEETIYRQVTNYLLSQYFEFIDGKRTDIDLAELRRKNDQVDAVNLGIMERIRVITKGDANKNALVILNSLGRLLQLEIDENLKLLKYLF